MMSPQECASWLSAYSSAPPRTAKKRLFQLDLPNCTVRESRQRAAREPPESREESRQRAVRGPSESRQRAVRGPSEGRQRAAREPSESRQRAVSSGSSSWTARAAGRCGGGAKGKASAGLSRDRLRTLAAASWAQCGQRLLLGGSSGSADGRTAGRTDVRSAPRRRSCPLEVPPWNYPPWNYPPWNYPP
jgi:hypothetical protein